MAAPEGFRRVRALSARTHFVLGHGQIHFDPDSMKEDVKHPLLPEDQIDLLVARGWVADDLDEAAPAAPASAVANASKAQGKRGGRRAAPAASPAAPAAPAAPAGEDDQAPAA